jgi:hypothetical protein
MCDKREEEKVGEREKKRKKKLGAEDDYISVKMNQRKKEKLERENNKIRKRNRLEIISYC